MKPSAWRTLAVLLLGVLIATCGGSDEQSDPTPHAMTTISEEAFPSWIEYSSDQLGVAIEHPSNWYPHEIDTISGIPMTSFSAPVDNPNPQIVANGQHLLFTVWREELDTSVTLEDWAIEQLTAPYGIGPATRKYVQLGDVPGLQLSFGQAQTTVTAFHFDEYRYVMMADVQGASIDSFAVDLDRVMQSIRFAP